VLFCLYCFSREQEPASQVETFAHLRLWNILRLDMVDLFAVCAKLMMKLVVRVEMASSSTVTGLDEATSIALEAMNNESAQLWKHVESTQTPNFEQFQYTDLLLSPEALFMNPPGLPSVSMTSFYVKGPYCSTLKAYLDLVRKVCIIFDASSNNRLEQIDKDIDVLLEELSSPIATMVGLQSGPADGSTFPSPPSTDVFASNQHPSAILVGMGTAVETLVLVLLFTSSLVAMLRPRRFAHQPFAGKEAKRNNKKKTPDAVEKEAKPPVTHVTAFLDRFAVKLVDGPLTRLVEVSGRLGYLATEWAGWCTDRGARALSTAAINAASAAGLADGLAAEWKPNPEDCPAICHDIATNLQTGFSELSSICAKKGHSFSAMKTELDMFTKLNQPTS